jgi:ferrous-iron efflux pump FieF
MASILPALPADSVVDEKTSRLLRRATAASVAVAGTLVVVKLVAWLFTDSVSLLSTLIDSLLDVAASFLNLLAVRHALEPPDREHRFGHGKAEPLAGLAQAMFITGSAIFLLIEAGQRLIEPQAVSRPGLGISVMVISIIATFFLTRFQAYVIKRTKSVAIRADSLHYVGDLLTNVAVIVAIVLTARFGWIYADPILAIAIAFYILKTAWGISNGALDMLMDRELPDEERTRIKQIVLAHPGVMALHELKTRAAGPTSFIQLHIEMDGDLPLRDAHRIADEVEASLREAFTGAEVVIHQDPFGIETPRIVEP